MIQYLSKVKYRQEKDRHGTGRQKEREPGYREAGVKTERGQDMEARRKDRLEKEGKTGRGRGGRRGRGDRREDRQGTK
jgi:hypothetical protein